MVETSAGRTPELVCAKCNQVLVKGKVTVAYLGFAFPYELLKCPTCGRAFVSEALATEKMAHVEQMVEDK
ncbi:MAG TPA: hypothetical protein VMK12_04610 [Anaeromyxobacteraceae bacterium]|nr:hypothetical protein [Anaeromyxobacteraceae bacterium]